MELFINEPYGKYNKDIVDTNRKVTEMLQGQQDRTDNNMTKLIDLIIAEDFTAEDRYYLDNVNEEGKQIFYIRKRAEYDKKLRIECMRQAVKNHYMKYANKLIEDEGLNCGLETIEKMKKEEEQIDKEKKTDYLLITVSPVEGALSANNAVQVFHKLEKLKYIKSSLSVVEQRYDGVPNDRYKKIGDGLHTHHIIHYKDRKKSEIKRDLLRIYGGKDVPCNIDLRYIQEGHLERTKNYLLGDKKDECKHAKQDQDKLFRIQCNIKDYYEFNLL